SGLGDDQAKAAGDYRERGQVQSAVRRGPGHEAARGRLPGGSADRDEVSQDAQHPVVPAAQGLGPDRVEIVTPFSGGSQNREVLRTAAKLSHLLPCPMTWAS